MRKLLLVAAVLLAGGGYFLWKARDAAAPAPAAAAPAKATAGGAAMAMPVEAEAAKTERLARELIAVGSLRSDESVNVSSEIAGRVARIGFREGQRVAAGELLFALDDSVHQAEVQQARAALALSERNHARALELFNRSLISARERDEAASKLAVDQATLALTEARLAKTRIKAPFAGVVGLRLVSPGSYVQSGQELVSLEALDTLKADFRLSEAALPFVAVGQALSIEVDAYPGQTFPGRVYAIDPRLAEDTRSIGLRARVPNTAGKLRPGLFARVKLTIAQKDNALTVPEQAIVPQGEKLFVYVIEDGKAALRPVEVGMRMPGRAEILSGVKAGEIVITAGVQKIGPGAAVTPVNQESGVRSQESEKTSSPAPTPNS